MSTFSLTEGLNGSNITFILSDMIDLEGTLTQIAAVDEGTSITSAQGEVLLVADIDKAIVRNMFLMQTDASSIDDVSNTDILYKQVLDTDSYGFRDAVMSALVSSVSDGTDANGHATNVSQQEEYVQYIAHNVFGTRKGADLFNNETELRNGLYADMSDSFTTFIDEQKVDSSYNISTEIVPGGSASLEKLSERLLRTIMRSQGTRLDVAVGDDKRLSDTADYQPVPLGAGDVLVLKYTVIDNNTHASDLNSNAWDATGTQRRYIIKLTLV